MYVQESLAPFEANSPASTLLHRAKRRVLMSSDIQRHSYAGLAYKAAPELGKLLPYNGNGRCPWDLNASASAASYDNGF